MDTPDDISHVTDSLRQLQVQQQTVPNIDDDVTKDPDAPVIPHSRDDYGFRKSGISTPMSGPNNPSPNRLDNVVPDPNGLGWPGEWSSETQVIGS
jgi:GTP cyclohydrolase I